jgi:hypothetical protein
VWFEVHFLLDKKERLQEEEEEERGRKEIKEEGEEGDRGEERVYWWEGPGERRNEGGEAAAKQGAARNTGAENVEDGKKVRKGRR